MRAELQNLPQGWPHHGEKILDLLDAHRPQVCVELGTWRGASAIAIARVIRQWGGVLYCVDTWTGNVSGSRGGTIPGPCKMLAECATNLIRAGVSSSVRLIPSRTDAAASQWRGPIDFLYVDADHAKLSVRGDLLGWYPHLRPGALFCGDDYENPMYPGVKEAWDDFEQEQGLALERFATPQTNPPGMRLIYGFKKVDA